MQSVNIMIPEANKPTNDAFQYCILQCFPFLCYRNQGSCGSCYAFSSMGMLESRLRVQTNNTLQVQLSPQDVVSCSQLSQGCDGGFPFLVAGKYAKVGTLYIVQNIHLIHWHVVHT